MSAGAAAAAAEDAAAVVEGEDLLPGPAFAARGLATYRLPSTSPAHAGLSLEAKLARWWVLVDDGWIAP